MAYDRVPGPSPMNHVETVESNFPYRLGLRFHKSSNALVRNVALVLHPSEPFFLNSTDYRTIEQKRRCRIVSVVNSENSRRNHVTLPLRHDRWARQKCQLEIMHMEKCRPPYSPLLMRAVHQSKSSIVIAQSKS